MVSLLLSLMMPAHAQDAAEPWLAVVRSSQGYELRPLSDATLPNEPVMALQSGELLVGRLRSDPQGPRRLGPGDVHTVADVTAMWQLVPFAASDAPFWSDDTHRLAIVRTDLKTGAQRSQVLQLGEAPALQWAGDLNRDGEPDWLLGAGTPELWMSGANGWSRHAGAVVTAQDVAVPAES